MRLRDLTKPQRQLMSNLSLGCRVTYRGKNYTVIDKNGKTVDRIWPATFYAFFDNDLVEQDSSGDYMLSKAGWKVFYDE